MLKYCLCHRIVLTAFNHKNLSNLSFNESQYNKRFLVGYMRFSSVSENIIFYQINRFDQSKCSVKSEY